MCTKADRYAQTEDHYQRAKHISNTIAQYADSANIVPRWTLYGEQELLIILCIKKSIVPEGYDV